MKKLKHNESTKKILSVIFNNQPVSRKKIAELTGYSKAAVSYGIDELLHQGLVMEKGLGRGNKNGGPRPINLYINENYGYVVSILLRQQDPLIEINSINGNTIKICNFSKHFYQEFSSMLKEAVFLIDKAVDEIGKENFIGLGISVPGNVVDNKVVYSPYYDINDIDVVEIFSNKFGVNVYVERDVFNMAYGERWKGEGSKYKNFVAIWSGTGIGSAIVIDSKLVKGMGGFAGEIGFMATSEETYKIGRYTLNDFGYFESNASVKKLEKKYNMPFNKIVEQSRIHTCILKDIHHICNHFAMGIANIIAMLNPEAVIINGRFSQINREMQDYLYSKISSITAVGTYLEYSLLGVKAITLGGTYLVLTNELGIEF